MKIILFSDIHANLPALERALELLDLQKPDMMFCLGDLVGYHIWPNEVIAQIRRRGIATIAGNHDAKVGTLSPAQLEETGKNYAYKIISGENKDYLSALPAHIRLDFQLNGNTLRMLLVHGSPDSNDEYLLENKPEGKFLAVFNKADADILCFGHSHKRYYRILDTGNEPRRFKHAINTGSVGKPKDGNPQGGFVVLTISSNINVDFVRFDYDVEKAAVSLEESPLPTDLADMLRKAY